MALDDATAALLAQLSELGGPPLHELEPAEARALGGRMREFYGPGPEMASTEDVTIRVDAATDITARRFTPVAEPVGVLVYFHGGGWLMGGIEEFDTLARQLAQRTGCTVLLVDYRLAPEHPFPAAVDDAWASLLWAVDRRAELAGADAPVIVAGDSAGANLAAVVSRRARDLRGPAVAMQVLIYPVADSDFETPSYVDPANQLMLSRETMRWFFDHYVREAALLTHPDVAPLRAGDLSGLAPAVVLTAEHDVLRSEGEAYAKAMADAGTPVDHRCFEGQMHGFFTLVNVLPGSAHGIDYVVDAVAGATSVK